MCAFLHFYFFIRFTDVANYSTRRHSFIFTYSYIKYRTISWRFNFRFNFSELILAISSPFATLSPALIFQLVIIPSFIAIPNFGITTSTAMCLSPFSSFYYTCNKDWSPIISDTVSITFSGVGKYNFSSGGENGTGVCGAVIRLIGASNKSKPLSATIAAISVAILHLGFASSITIRRFVFQQMIK